MLSPAARRRVASGVAAAIAALGLVALGPVGSAKADNTVDQITGSGVTDSAVTVRWDKGLLGSDNRTVVKPRDSNDPYAFMHDDFKNLEVTVGQTRDIVHQGIKVSWTGGKPMTGEFHANFLQIMECYGDLATGPEPENCQFGSEGLKKVGAGGSGVHIGSRGGNFCATHTPSVTEPAFPDESGTGPLVGCDPAEDPSASGYSHFNAAAGGPHSYTVPFVPAGTTNKLYLPNQYGFNKYNSNEMQQVVTRADGTGEVYFNALTKDESPGLGCGQVKADSTARGCWLVIVPRGEYEPNGWKLQDFDTASIIQESPLGAATFAQRIQIHLDYSPLGRPCNIGESPQRLVQGTELVSRAVYSWQLALNAEAACRLVYTYSPTSEGSNTSQLASTTSPTGLAFTTVPIGSEAARGGGDPPTLPHLVYAPIAVSATAFGFNINGLNGYHSAPVRLTPRLAAKALTQSYKSELTDANANAGTGPAWAKKNPVDITRDPEFVKLNPTVGERSGTQIISPLLIGAHDGIVEQLWAWILGDQTARDWLGGKPDDSGMVVNELYQKLDLGKGSPSDSFPRVATCFNTGDDGEPKNGRCTLDLLPYMENFDEVASRVSVANNPHGAQWDKLLKAPDSSEGWWGVAQPIEFPGQIFMYGVMDTASAASYGVVQAQLCKADGTGCVAPSEASVGAALSGAKADASGLLQVDPAHAGSGAYPLVTVTYAAVRKGQDTAALTDYAAFIKFAATEGQTPGVKPGQLPHGYLPMPQNLRNAALAAAAAMFLPDPTPTTATATATTGTTGGGNTGTGNTGSSSSGVPATGARPVVSSTSAAPFTTSKASPVPAALNTAPLSIGAVRWALLVVLIAGLAGAVGGPVLRFALSRRTPP